MGANRPEEEVAVEGGLGFEIKQLGHDFVFVLEWRPEVPGVVLLKVRVATGRMNGLERPLPLVIEEELLLLVEERADEQRKVELSLDHVFDFETVFKESARTALGSHVSVLAADLLEAAKGFEEGCTMSLHLFAHLGQGRDVFPIDLCVSIFSRELFYDLFDALIQSRSMLDSDREFRCEIPLIQAVAVST